MLICVFRKRQVSLSHLVWVRGKPRYSIALSGFLTPIIQLLKATETVILLQCYLPSGTHCCPFHHTSSHKLHLKHSAQRKLIHGVGMETVYVCMWQDDMMFAAEGAVQGNPRYTAADVIPEENKLGCTVSS